MANDVFDLCEHVEVSLYAYASDVMVWSVSRWDEDYWSDGTDTEGWRVITSGVSSIEIENGCFTNQGLIRPDPARAVVTFQSPDYDPFTNVTIRTGTPVRIRVKINPDTSPTWVTLYQGKIMDSVASYSRQWLNLVTINCVTDLQDVINYTSPTGFAVPTPSYALSYWTVMNADGGFNVSCSSVPDFLGDLVVGQAITEPVVYGDLINSLMDTNSAALVYRPIGGLPSVPGYYLTRQEIGTVDDASEAVAFEAEPSSNPIRAEFDDITIGFNTEDIVNQITYTISGGSPVTLGNAQSKALMGELSLVVDTLHYDSTEAYNWASSLGAILPQRSVLDISAPVIYRSGAINTNLLRDPFDRASVSVNNSAITINERYFITGIKHTIDADSWNATFTLWRGR
jgi:hypothetical protein